MIRVLDIISDTNLGGAGRVVLNYLKYADRQRFSTAVAAPRGSRLAGPLRAAGADVLEVDAMADRSYAREDVTALESLIREIRPDIVHTHGAFSGRVAAKRCGVPVVYSRHSAFPVKPYLRYPPGRWAYALLDRRFADHVIAVSPAAMRNLTDMGVSPKRITVVMNGSPPVEPISLAERAALRADLGIGPAAVVFGILARIEDYKGHLYLVEAARLLKERGRSGFCFLVAGSGSFEEQVKRAVEAAGVSGVVRMLGFRRDVPALLGCLDVQLNCSYGTEATSLALLEGMSLGLPTIASDYGGNPWVVRDGETGLLFPARDAAALANAVERLLDDPGQRERMGCNARKLYQAQFTGEVFARNTERVYQNVLKGVKHGKA